MSENRPYPQAQPAPSVALPAAPPKRRVRRGRLIAAVIFAALVVVVIIASVAGGGKSKPKSKSSSPSGSNSGAAKFVTAVASDSKVVHAEVANAVADAGELAKGTTSDSSQLSADAQQAHDDASNLRDETAAAPNSSDSDELAFEVAINDVKSAMSALVAMANNPTGSAAVEVRNKLQPAIDEWNTSVRKLWQEAGVTNPPTI